MFDDFFLFVVLTALIFLYLKDKKDLIIATKKRTKDKILLIIVTLPILIVIILFAQTWAHYLAGILGLVLVVIMWHIFGITSKGIIIRMGQLSFWGHWHKLKRVEVSLDEEGVKMVIHGGKGHILFKSVFLHGVHYYKEENYEKVVNLLRENLPEETLIIKK